jgi:AcrR family transcriptional regulator
MSAATDTEEARARRPAREKIFNAAKELFYQHGIRGVSVDGIAAHAGATKMSLYRSFASKDELVAECLRDQDAEFRSWWDSVVEPLAGDPKAQLLALIDAFVTAECDKDNRGCPLANAIVELHEDHHPGRAVVFEYKAEIRRRLNEMCTALGARDPGELGDALMLLIEGGYICRLTFRSNNSPTDRLPRIARTLIESHLASG